MDEEKKVPKGGKKRRKLKPNHPPRPNGKFSKKGVNPPCRTGKMKEGGTGKLSFPRKNQKYSPAYQQKERKRKVNEKLHIGSLHIIRHPLGRGIASSGTKEGERKLQLLLSCQEALTSRRGFLCIGGGEWNCVEDDSFAKKKMVIVEEGGEGGGERDVRKSAETEAAKKEKKNHQKRSASTMGKRRS